MADMERAKDSESTPLDVETCKSVLAQIREMIEQKTIIETSNIKTAIRDVQAYVDKPTPQNELRARPAMATLEAELRKQSSFDRPFDTQESGLRRAA